MNSVSRYDAGTGRDRFLLAFFYPLPDTESGLRTQKQQLW